MKKIAFILLSILICATAYAQWAEDARSISPLLIGAEVPNLTLQTADGKAADIRELIIQKPTVLIFYRGGWCPYCNAHLGKIAEIENEILAQGYQVIAVSPDEPERLANTAEKQELKYTLLSDGDGALTQAMGIAFKAPDAKWKANQLQKHSGGKNSGFLPVPSVFVVNTKGEILFEYINPDYKHRIEGKLLMAVLKALK